MDAGGCRRLCVHTEYLTRKDMAATSGRGNTYYIGTTPVNVFIRLGRQGGSFSTVTIINAYVLQLNGLVMMHIPFSTTISSVF